MAKSKEVKKTKAPKKAKISAPEQRKATQTNRLTRVAHALGL